MKNTNLPHDTSKRHYSNLTISQHLAGDYLSQELIAEYQAMLHGFVSAAKRKQVTILPWQSPEALHFVKLDEEFQKSIISDFKKYISNYHDAVEQGFSPYDEKKVLWNMIKNMKLHPTSDLFEKIQDDDVVEIYETPRFVQIYRSFKFYRMCSYSLDEILCRPWWELYYRDSVITQQIDETVKQCVTAASPKTTDYNLPVHELKEIDSVGKYEVKQKIRFVSPLFNSNGNIAAVVNVSRPLSVKGMPSGSLNDLGLKI